MLSIVAGSADFLDKAREEENNDGDHLAAAEDEGTGQEDLDEPDGPALTNALGWRPPW